MGDGRIWYLYTAEGQQGPYVASELATYLNDGTITGEWLVWKEGMDTWQPISMVAELTVARAAAPAPLPPPTVESTETATQPLQETVRQRKCPACGGENTEDDLNCLHCGVNFREWAADQQKERAAAAEEKIVQRDSRPVQASTPSGGYTFQDGFILGLWNLIPFVGGLVYLYKVCQIMFPDNNPIMATIGWVLLMLIPGVNLIAIIVFLCYSIRRLGCMFLIGASISNIIAGAIIAAMMQ